MPAKQADKQHTFVIPDDQSIPAIISLLQKTSSVRVIEETVFHRVFYDTFDWRLSRNGSALEVHTDGLISGQNSGQNSGQSSRIYWRADKEARLKIQLGLKNVPPLAADLPVCEFRQQLQSVISVRELSPRIKIRVKRHSLAILDKNKKIVVRLNFDVYWFNPSKLRAARVLTRRLTIRSVKGYSDDYQSAKVFFSDITLPKSQSRQLTTPLPAPLKTAQDNVMNLALIASGINTAEYSTSLKLRLDPDMPGDQASKIIMLRLLEIVKQNTAGCIKARDTEFLHDYGVAISKTDLLLKQLDLHPRSDDTEYGSYFSKLGKLIRPVRDLDVFLMQLDEYRTGFIELDRDIDVDWQQLQPLHDYLLQLRKGAHDKLIEEMKSTRYRTTIKQWRHYLTCSTGEDTEAATEKGISGKAVYKIADELLWGLNLRLLKQGKTIDNRNADNSNAGSLHELRTTCEQLCYSIAFFSSLYPAKEMREITRLVADMQDELSLSNDRNMQISTLQTFIKHSDKKEVIQTSKQLIKTFERQHIEADKNLEDAYGSYVSSGSQKKIKELFVNYRRGKMKL